MFYLSGSQCGCAISRESFDKEYASEYAKALRRIERRTPAQDRELNHARNSLLDLKSMFEVKELDEALDEAMHWLETHSWPLPVGYLDLGHIELSALCLQIAGGRNPQLAMAILKSYGHAGSA